MREGQKWADVAIIQIGNLQIVRDFFCTFKIFGFALVNVRNIYYYFNRPLQIKSCCFHSLFIAKYTQLIHFIALRSISVFATITAVLTKRTTIYTFNVSFIYYFVVLIKNEFCSRLIFCFVVMTACKKIYSVCVVARMIIFKVFRFMLNLVCCVD